VTEPGHIWRQIEALLAGATGRVTLVAPFIKREVFEAALAAVPTSVRDIQCVTRWSVMEVAAGVSDPEIMDIAKLDGRPNVLLCHALHAKLFLVDDRCLVGSANLTSKATGRIPQENIEILVESDAAHPEVRRLLHLIEAEAISATPELAASVRAQADLLKQSGHAAVLPGGEEQPSRWYPITRRPERIYPLYCGRGDYSPSVQEGIIRDLAHLDIPPGLSEEDFNNAVRIKLHAMPEIQGLLANGRLSNLELEKAIAQQTGATERAARRATENIAEWLKYFDHFYTAVGSWELRPGRELT
jgi:hypothetical protein